MEHSVNFILGIGYFKAGENYRSRFSIILHSDIILEKSMN